MVLVLFVLCFWSLSFGGSLEGGQSTPSKDEIASSAEIHCLLAMTEGRNVVIASDRRERGNRLYVFSPYDFI